MRLFTLLSLFLVCLPAAAHATLLITPLKVVMEGRDRTANIVVVNTGQYEATYRMEWEQLIQVQDKGGYILDTNEESTHLKDFAVFTPRQITLQPQEKQTVRVAIRRPGELPVGEYKSHLKFRVVDDGKVGTPNLDNPNTNEVSVGARVLASYSLPIVYRVGEQDVQVSIMNPEFAINPASGNMLIKLPVQRSGVHGVLGLIEVYHRPNGGEETLVSTLGNSSLFSEITQRIFTIVTNLTGLSPGTMRIVFKKDEKMKADQVVIAERSIAITN